MALSKYLKNTSRMATRKSPTDEDDHTPDSPPQNPLKPTTNLESLLVEITKMNATLQSVATDVSMIKETTTELKTTVAEMQGRLKEAETRIAQLEEASERLLRDGGNTKQNEAMWGRIQALENHNRRNNMRLMGLKETYGTNGTLLSCVQKILTEVLGMNMDEEFEIERVHRSLAPMPNADRPPRPVLIRFLRQSARDKVISAAKAKRGLDWEGCRLSLFPDMTKELAEKRKTFTSVKRKLQELNVRYTLVFPATLRLRWDGKNESFVTAAAAEKFVGEKLRGK
ncbi:hypothetical protein LDENG_00030590 [Lucifuga dentata]|nr:hypothetical protein LDENG_00030590 [Lucifuga dentata]